MTVQRIGLLVAVFVAVLVGYLATQSFFQETEAQSREGGRDPSFRSEENAKFHPDRIIVKTKPGVSDANLERLNRSNGASVEKRIPRTRLSVIGLPDGLPVETAINRYEASPAVEYAEPDFILKPSQTTSANDPDYPKLYGLNNTGQNSGTADADIDAPEAWYSTTGNADTIVAVIDTGVDTSHPDLKNNLWTNSGETAGNGIDDDNNGYVDDVNGWDFYHNDSTVYDSGDGDQHGTHVSGTIAAEGNNSLGVVGVNWKAKIMPLKFLGPDGGYTSDAVEALNYAVAKGVKISSNSWGGGGYSQALLDAINAADAKGHLFVAATGNGGSDGVGDDNDTTPHYPSSYNSANLISVAATDKNDALAGFSNYGSTSVDLAAPGVGILSTLPGNTYGSYSGTSMATPHVAGVAALIKSKSPSLDDAQIKAQILQPVDKNTNLQSKMVSGGRLNAAQGFDTTSPTAKAPVESLVDNSTLGTTNVPVKLTWSATDNTDGSGIASYQLQQSTNGGAYSDVSLPSSTATSHTPNLAPGSTYQFRVAAKDGAGNVSAWAEGSSFKVNASQESDTAITYSGSWTNYSYTGLYGGYAKYAGSNGPVAKLSFTGSSVAWVATKASNRGQAYVYVDGVYEKTVETYAANVVARQVVFQKDGLDPSKTHTIEVKVLGTSGRPYVDVDAFVRLG